MVSTNSEEDYCDAVGSGVGQHQDWVGFEFAYKQRVYYPGVGAAVGSAGSLGHHD